jgi:hypothetical protein
LNEELKQIKTKRDSAASRAQSMGENDISELFFPDNSKCSLNYVQSQGVQSQTSVLQMIENCVDTEKER